MAESKLITCDATGCDAMGAFRLAIRDVRPRSRWAALTDEELIERERTQDPDRPLGFDEGEDFIIEFCLDHVAQHGFDPRSQAWLPDMPSALPPESWRPSVVGASRFQFVEMGEFVGFVEQQAERASVVVRHFVPGRDALDEAKRRCWAMIVGGNQGRRGTER